MILFFNLRIQLLTYVPFLCRTPEFCLCPTWEKAIENYGNCSIRGVSNTQGRLRLGNSWGFYLPCRAARIIPRRHILGVVPCKISVQGCTVYIDHKSVCMRELSMGTKTYFWSLFVKQIEHSFPHNNRGKQIILKGKSFLKKIAGNSCFLTLLC